MSQEPSRTRESYDEIAATYTARLFRFLMPAAMVAHLDAAGFRVIERIEREPYPEAEHPSRRCYLLARSPADQ